MTKFFLSALIMFAPSLLLVGCSNGNTSKITPAETTAKAIDTPEYFNLRPKLEKDYGYSHAVKIGDDLKISGAVSMTDSGVVTARAIWNCRCKIATAICKKFYNTMAAHLMMYLQKIFIQQI